MYLLDEMLNFESFYILYSKFYILPSYRSGGIS